MSDINWSFSSNLPPDQFSLVYSNGRIVFFGQQEVSTTCELFVGTREECEAQIAELSLTAEPPPPPLEIEPEIVPATEFSTWAEFSTGAEFFESEEVVENSTTTQDPEE